MRFDGPPGEISPAFGVERVELVYSKLDAPPGAELPLVPARATRRPRQAQRNGFGDQLRTLIPRAALCRLRDTRSLGILIGQAPLLAVAIGLVLPRHVLTDDSLGPYYGVLLAFMLLTASIWLGTISACRELVGDQAIIAREAALGVSTTAQLIARCVTVFPLVLLQTALLAMVTLILQPVHQGALLVVAMTMFAGCSSACMGLWLSAASHTSDQATSTVPLLLIPQLLFAGALIPIDAMPAPLQVVVRRLPRALGAGRDRRGDQPGRAARLHAHERDGPRGLVLRVVAAGADRRDGRDRGVLPRRRGVVAAARARPLRRRGAPGEPGRLWAAYGVIALATVRSRSGTRRVATG